MRLADAITTKNITSVDEVQSVDNTDKVFVNDNGSFKQISVSNLMKQAPSGVTEETDPTVSEWAKQPTKPSYTADEVGALPVGTKIPTKTSDLTNDSGYLTQIPEEYVTETELGQKGYVIEDDIPEKLPSPGILTFTGAVNDTYDGSANKTINIPTGGGEGGTSDYNALANKPKLNGVEIAGNKTSTDYKIVSSEQGIENNGKFLGVGVDGNVTPVDKPTYTADEVGARPDTWTPSAEDVGALPNNTEIPSKTSDLENDSGFITNSDIPEKLPNPQKIIFTGAVSAEYDGSTQQTINIPTGGGSDPYTLPIMSDTQLGGGKAVSKTDEDVPVAVDPLTGQLFVPTYPENTGGDTINVDAELKEYMNVAKPAIASAIINKGGSVEPDDSLNDYATRISAIPNDIYPAETLPVQTNLSASGLQDSIGIKLNWSDVNASGYLILRKENAMPATSADGDIVYNGTYAADGYTDTGVQKGKVYYYRIFPRNSKNQYQSLEDGAVAMVDYKDRTGETLLGDLPLGSKIKFGQYSGADYFWEIVDTQDKASGFVTVAADQNLGNMQFDAPEPNSPISNRKTQGNNRWAYSAARQLLNSDADADTWWSAQYEYDAAPSYATRVPGFLKDFTTYEKGIVVTKTNKCILPNDDGGGTETVEDKFWLPSYYAMGLGVIQPLEDDHIYEKYTDNASRSYQSNYWLRSINGAESPSNVRFVNSSGTAGSFTASSSVAVRPFCQLPTSAYMTWSVSDEAYVFADDSQRNPSA